MSRIVIPLAILLPAFCLFGQAQNGSSAAPSAPDTSLRRFEVGGQATDMRLGGCFGEKGCLTPQFGLGAGVALNISQHFAIDSSFNLLPSNDTIHVYSLNGAAQGGHAMEFLAGARAQLRARRYSFFAVAKPGLVSWSQVLTLDTDTRNSSGTIALTQSYSRRTFFAVEAGGGVEYSPTPRVHIRVDMGDLLVQYYTKVVVNFLGTVSTVCPVSCHPWTNNLQTTAGVYWSMGKPIAWTPPDVLSVPEYKFFDRTNVALLG